MTCTKEHQNTSTQSMGIQKQQEGSETKNKEEVKSHTMIEEMIISNVHRSIRTYKDRIQIAEVIDNKYHSSNKRDSSLNLCRIGLSHISSNNYSPNQELNPLCKRTGSRLHRDRMTCTVPGCFIHKVRLKTEIVKQENSNTMVQL